ncbi:MAG: hypothetical protein GXO94_08290 [Nitrospirae bacterium]|nr:hypothetical protein [Nitrospirota bacterium]
MNEKTRLEQELERVQNQGKQWRGIVVLLVALLLFAALYIVSLRQKLYDAHETLRALNLETDTLRLEIETLKLDAARCSDAAETVEGPAAEGVDTRAGEEGGESAANEKDLQTRSVE